MLETIWSSKPELRFKNIPWQPFNAQELRQKCIERRKAAARPEPYRLEPSYDVYQGDNEKALLESSRAYLDRPVDNGWPYDDSLEAFNTMQKLHDLLPGGMPVAHSWSFEIELALQLGKREAQDIITRLMKFNSTDPVTLRESRDSSWMGDCLCLKDFVPVSSSLPSEILKLSPQDAKMASTGLIKAINSRISSGQQLPLESLNWQELLDRFAEAAISCYEDRWSGTSFQKPRDLLCAPATQAEIESAERDLGCLLPQDFKEMVALHNGWAQNLTYPALQI